MTEFFQPTTHVRADWEFVLTHSLTAVAQPNPRVSHPVDRVTNMRHLVKFVLHDLGTGVRGSSQKDELFTEQIAKVPILNEKFKHHHINVDAPYLYLLT